jgi:hypothetical protein
VVPLVEGCLVATLEAVATSTMPAFPHAAPARDLPTAVLLAQDDLSTRLTVLTLNCWQNPEATSRVLMLLEDVSAVVEECEDDLGTYRSPHLFCS